MSTDTAPPASEIRTPTDRASRRPIRTLGTVVVNQIAAGEVIERPASVVKELLENSIDAGATQVEVSLRNGGLDSIRVADDGCGIPADELGLAVSSHATSKIAAADDLFRVATFGFRGEALASIAAVSHFAISSRTPDSDSGQRLAIRGGIEDAFEPCGMSPGTTVTVDELFFNTPVRRKFLRTSQTEVGHVAEAFTRIALAHPDRRLTLVHNGRVLHELAPVSEWRTRIADFFGPEIGDSLIEVTGRHEPYGLEGFVVDPSVSRSHNRMQYLFLNGRFIRDRSLQHALSEAYRGLLMTGKFPVCFLRLDMPFDLVDVNVHPAKLEVRFQDSGRVYSHVLGTIRNRFLTTDLTSRAQLARTGGWSAEQVAGPFPALPGSPVAPPLPSPFHQSSLGLPVSPVRNWVDSPRVSPPAPAWPMPQPHQPQSFPPAGHAAPAGPAPQVLPQSDQPHSADPAPGRQLALQVHNTYLITETEEGMVVIDQHALHERILYEQMREKVAAGGLEVQPLLVPEPVSLTSGEAAAVLENATTLRQIGIEVQPFGGDTVLVSGYPAMLANLNPSAILRGVTEVLLTPGAQLQRRDVLDELLHMIACKAAIKAGDRLTRDEIAALLEHRAYCQDSHHCPHGRPTALVFSRTELDRRFKRI